MNKNNTSLMVNIRAFLYILVTAFAVLSTCVVAFLFIIRIFSDPSVPATWFCGTGAVVLVMVAASEYLRRKVTSDLHAGENLQA